MALVANFESVAATGMQGQIRAGSGPAQECGTDPSHEAIESLCDMQKTLFLKIELKKQGANILKREMDRR